MQDATILRLFRGGTIPMLCSASTGCLALYGSKVQAAAEQWRSLKVVSEIDRRVCAAHAVELKKHAAGCAALTLSSAAATVEAVIDYRQLRVASQDQLATYLCSRVPFFGRPLVLATALASVLASASLVGGCRLMAPERPRLQQPPRSLTAMARAGTGDGANPGVESHAGASPHWEELWSGGLAKGSRFDVAGESLPLAAELRRRNHAPRGGMSALVPGCGRAYDALALARHGFASVVALDVSASACEAARTEIGGVADEARLRVDVRCEDFFALQPERDGTYDLIWDNTFLCALVPEVRERWAAQMKALLAPGGELITCVFPIGAREGGPPFAMSVPLVRALLEPLGFEATSVQDRLPLEEQHRRPGDPLESVRTRGTALVTWRLRE